MRTIMNSFLDTEEILEFRLFILLWTTSLAFQHYGQQLDVIFREGSKKIKL